MVLVLLSWSLSMNLYNLQAEWWQWNAKMFLLIMWSMCAVGISSLSKTFICSLTLKGEIKGLGGGKFGSSDVKCGNYYFMLVFPHSGLVEKNILMPRRPCEYISLEWFFHPLSLYACWMKTTGVVYGPDAAILQLWYLWNRSVTLQSFVIRHQKGVEWDENELIFII